MAQADPLVERIVACETCERLRSHCREIARVKRRAYREEEYWGRPVPPFGPRSPRLLVVGLAPGAHGANRTGRVFTGDSSGDWLYRALHAHGFANRAESVRAGDGLALRDATVTCAVRCAPPGNRPRPSERDACLPYLVEEIRRARRLRVVLALGRFAFDAFLRAWPAAGRVSWEERPAFAHGAETRAGDGRVTLLASYHPSRQNTQTGRLTEAMFDAPFARARALLEDS
ncbi:MAG: uracil-DNA glycosylase [Gemmatimonadetes bacterium]|nr:uracil-DNA glycosylase [Gemmatimonadota bacterium]